MSKKITQLSILLGFSFASVGLGVADTKVKAQDNASRQADLRSYDFEDDLVLGDLVDPDGEVLMVRRRGTRESLVRPRTDYVPELLKSAADL